MADLAINKPPAYLGSSEIQKHSHEDDCWIIVHSKVYDVSDFHKEHPGGSNIIMRYAGGDATAAYDEIHAPGIIEDALPRDRFLGLVHESEMKKLNTEENSDSSDRGIDERVQIHPSSNTAISPLPIAPSQAQQGIYTKPLLQSLISTHDFEDVARHLFTKKAFAFYSSAATDLVTHNLNSSYYRQILLRPRVLRNVKEVSIKRRILGCESSAPFFVSPAAMARLAHPDGEMALARGCAGEGIIQVVCFAVFLLPWFCLSSVGGKGERISEKGGSYLKPENEKEGGWGSDVRADDGCMCRFHPTPHTRLRAS